MNSSSTQSPFFSDETRSPYNLDAINAANTRRTRSPFSAGRVFTTPTARLLQVSCGLTADQLEKLFNEAPARIRDQAATQSLESRAGRRFYGMFTSIGLAAAIALFGAAVVALVLA